VGALIDLPHQDSDLLKELTDEGSKWHAILNYQVNNRYVFHFSHCFNKEYSQRPAAVARSIY